MKSDYDYWWLKTWRLEKYNSIVSITLSNIRKVLTHTTLKDEYNIRRNF